MSVSFLGHSPRLGRNLTAKVTVQDDDSPHGILSFRTTKLWASENATNSGPRKVELEVQRTGGTLGQVSVLVRTVGGGEPWMTGSQSLKGAMDKGKLDANATVGRDYSRLRQKLTFSVSWLLLVLLLLFLLLLLLLLLLLCLYVSVDEIIIESFSTHVRHVLL